MIFGRSDTLYINWQLRELNLKVVYYGPGRSGKTTNLEQIHMRVPDHQRSDMVSLKTQDDRTLFFDFFQLELGKISGLTPKIQLYTVPGQTYYEASRRVVLRGADGVVFVADSRSSRLRANIHSWENMKSQLASFSTPLTHIPIVVQLNKRDLQDALPDQFIKRKLNINGYPVIEAVAIEGKGVFDTLKSITRLVMQSVQKNAV
jgi:signal recognition particle receptor subunit beta